MSAPVCARFTIQNRGLKNLANQDGFYAYEKSCRYDPQTNRHKYRLIKLSGSVDASGALTLAETTAEARVTGH